MFILSGGSRNPYQSQPYYLAFFLGGGGYLYISSLIVGTSVHELALWMVLPDSFIGEMFIHIWESVFRIDAV